MVEVIVVTTIIVVAVLAALYVASKSVYVSRQSLHTTQASFLLEEGAEVMRILRDNDWANISTLTDGTNYYMNFSGSAWSLSEIPTVLGIYTRKISVSSVQRDGSTSDIVSSGGYNDDGTKMITITVSWEESGNTVTKTLSFYLTDLFS